MSNDDDGNDGSNNNNTNNTNNNNNTNSIVPSLRILCLHDSNSNARELSDKLEPLGERLYENHAIDLVYINSPLMLVEQQNQNQQHQQQQNSNSNSTVDPKKRIWWVEDDKEQQQQQQQEEEGESNENIETKDNDDNDDKNHQNQNHQHQQQQENKNKKQYDGLDCSLLLLRQVWTSMPFWGIIGVGHGAAIGSFLPLLPDLSMPGFCIWVNGETLLLPEEEEEELPPNNNDNDDDEGNNQNKNNHDDNERLIDNLPCLHIVAPNPGPSSQRLYKQYGGTVCQGGSNFTKSTINTIGKFIVEQKKRLRYHTSPETQKVLALQNMLYLKEQEAATAVAQHIANNPPKVLTAVISQQSVGGFSGGTKRNPVGTGGAPCPTEFILKKDKRNQPPTSNGPSREHPSQQQQQQDEEEEEEESPPKDD